MDKMTKESNTLTDRQIKKILIKNAIDSAREELNSSALRAALTRKSKRLEYGDTIDDIFSMFEEWVSEYDVASWESHDMWKIKEYVDKPPWHTETYQVNTIDPEEFIFIRFQRENAKIVESILKFFNVRFQKDIIWDRIHEV